MKHTVAVGALIVVLITPELAHADSCEVAYKREDWPKALVECRRLAFQGSAPAFHFLGMMYFNGFGVSQDYVLARRWLLQGAGLGNTWAQFDLGVMFRNGQGVPQDYVQAHMWFSLAAAKGNRLAAEARNSVEQKMTPTDISKAQWLARKWSVKRGKK